MNETTSTDLRAWLEHAVDLYVKHGEVPDAYPPGIADVRWEHNSPLARWDGGDVWTREKPQPRPGWTFTAVLDSGQTIEVWRP